jgi:DNA gyrase/topoisomerase IV subunit B
VIALNDKQTKFTFTSEFDTLKQTLEFRADTLDEILQNFEYFLRGCGFYFNGHLDFIDEDSVKPDTEEDELNFNDWNVNYKYVSERE